MSPYFGRKVLVASSATTAKNFEEGSTYVALVVETGFLSLIADSSGSGQEAR